MIHAGRSLLDVDAQYRRRMRYAYVVAALLHGALLFLTPSVLVPELHSGRVALAGPERRLEEITPETYPLNDRESAPRSHPLPGAMTWVEFVIVDHPDPAEQPPPLVADAREPVVPRHGPRVQIGALQPLRPQPVVEVHLDENLQTRSFSRPSARTEEFAILQMTRPAYPEVSLWGDVQGLVTLRATVSPQGLVSSVDLMANETDPYCEEAATQALMHWRFRPLHIADEPVWFSVVVPFRFQILE